MGWALGEEIQDEGDLLPVVVEKNVPMETGDGLTLYSDVFRPDTDEKYPVLLLRTAYDKEVRFTPDGIPATHVSETHFFPQRGYVVVAQDVRGRHASEGDFIPFADDPQDGADAIEWCSTLPWGNGKVAMVGQSYQGLTQYLAAGERPEKLLAASPVSGPVRYFENCVYRRGVFELGWMLAYLTGLARDTLARRGLLPELEAELDSWLLDPEVRFSPFTDEIYRLLPIRDWAKRLADGAPYLRDWLDNPADGPYWEELDSRDHLLEAEIPMLHVGSWYDVFQPDTLRMYEGLSGAAAGAQRLIMGPWAHIPFCHPTSGGTGEADFGPEALIELHRIQLRWYDHFLKGIDTGMLDEPPVRIFVMGENRWRDEGEWPLARTVYSPLYLRDDGRGDEGLSWDAPAEDEGSDSYRYDPEDPVPTRGGTTLMSLTLEGGVFDQRELEARDDVLTYTGEELSEDVEVTGPLTMKLFAASSAPDTDFAVKLVDVRPDGYAHNVAEGIVRARFRDSLYEPSLIEPGEIYEYEIDLWSTSHLFEAGHRLQVDITSSNFPRYDRNPNTGNEFATDTEMRPAEQTIFHDASHPSHVVLPLIPRS